MAKAWAIRAGSAFAALLLLRKLGQRVASLPTHSFSRMMRDLSAGRVRSIQFGAKEFLVKTAEGSYRTTIVPLMMQLKGADMSALLEKHGVVVSAPRSGLASKLGPALLLLMPFAYLMLSMRMLRGTMNPTDAPVGKKHRGGKKRAARKSARGGPLGGAGSDSASSDGAFEPTRNSGGRGEKVFPLFADVAGVDDAKRELMEVVDFIKRPGRYLAIGAHVPRGVLLSGPSGTGKTMLARATANEAGVPFISCSASEFVEAIVGRGAARVRELFERAGAVGGPCVVFIDELDAMGKARGGLHSHDEREQTLNQLLTEMDGFTTGGDARAVSILVLAATNRAETLDAALTRPGRFDRHVTVGLADAAGRDAILRVHTARVKLASDADVSHTFSTVRRTAERTHPPSAAIGLPRAPSHAAAPLSLSHTHTHTIPSLPPPTHHQITGIANRAAGLSGAELAGLVNDAALLAVRRGKHSVDAAALEEALSRAMELKVKNKLGKMAAHIAGLR